jgi:hypothetical protein
MSCSVRWWMRAPLVECDGFKVTMTNEEKARVLLPKVGYLVTIHVGWVLVPIDVLFSLRSISYLRHSA